LIRRYRGLVILIALVAASLAVLMVQQVRFNAFGSTFSRGDENTFLGLKLGLDLQGGTHLVYRVVPEGGGTPSADDVAAVRLTIDRRVNEFGVSEATVQELGNPPDRIIVQIPGQKGASLSINFRPSLFGPIYSSQQLEDFFRSDLGRPDAKVTQDPTDFSLTVKLDSIRPAELDRDGNVLVQGEADEWRPLIEAKFPTTVVIGFAGVSPTDKTNSDATPTPEASPTPEATATPEPAAEPVFPSAEQVQEALTLAGFPNMVIDEVATGQFAVDIVGLLPQRTAPDGTVIPADLDRIRDEVRLLGTLTIFAPQGDIIGWTVGGGVEEAKALIGSTAKLEFRERICGELTAPAGVDVWPPDGLTLQEWASVRCQNPRYYQEQSTPINAEDLTDAFAGTVEGVARPVVNIVFNNTGADAFFEVTDRISRTGNLLAIYLDGVELVAPSASQGISGGRAYINGPDFTAERARTIAIQLRSGALPATLDLIQERNVDATLGEESLRQSLVAGAIGLALLLVFMVTYYKVPGVVAALMLATYTVLLLAIFKLIPVTMTLSGAAAIILSLGFAVDANILIAERIKEELRTGRSLLSAINIGFDRAWSSIRDGNVSTLLTAGVLFWFGDRFSTSIMQGFALTLGIGVLLSMLTAYFFSRVLMRLIARTALGRRENLFVPVADNSSPASADGEA
jgi:preprotein translocase subunit SecD